jgi:hypothetical protein
MMSGFGSTAGDGAPYGFSSAFDSGNGELISATKDVLTVRMVGSGTSHFASKHQLMTPPCMVHALNQSDTPRESANPSRA